jgi:hypothetical protein
MNTLKQVFAPISNHSPVQVQYQLINFAPISNHSPSQVQHQQLSFATASSQQPTVNSQQPIANSQNIQPNGISFFDLHQWCKITAGRCRFCCKD